MDRALLRGAWLDRERPHSKTLPQVERRGRCPTAPPLTEQSVAERDAVGAPAALRINWDVRNRTWLLRRRISSVSKMLGLLREQALFSMIPMSEVGHGFARGKVARGGRSRAGEGRARGRVSCVGGFRAWEGFARGRVSRVGELRVWESLAHARASRMRELRVREGRSAESRRLTVVVDCARLRGSSLGWGDPKTRTAPRTAPMVLACRLARADSCSARGGGQT